MKPSTRMLGWALGVSIVLHGLLLGVWLLQNHPESLMQPLPLRLSLSLPEVARPAAAQAPAEPARRHAPEHPIRAHSAISPQQRAAPSGARLSSAAGQAPDQLQSAPPPASASLAPAGSTQAETGRPLPQAEPSGNAASQSLMPAHFLGAKRQPPYPDEARRLGHQGRAQLRVTLGPAGEVLQVELMQSSGYRELDQAAIVWARQGPYAPARRGNQSISAQLVLSCNFSLEY